MEMEDELRLRKLKAETELAERNLHGSCFRCDRVFVLECVRSEAVYTNILDGVSGRKPRRVCTECEVLMDKEQAQRDADHLAWLREQPKRYPRQPTYKNIGCGHGRPMS